jgi:tight adherence protein B
MLVLGLVAMYAALGVVVWLVGAPLVPRVPEERRAASGSAPPSALSGMTESVARSFERALSRRGLTERFTESIAAAGLKTRPGQYAVLVSGGTLGAAALGLLVSGALLALLLAAVVLAVGWKALGVLAGRRRAAFADQLDASLQLIASSLRAGHSLMRSLDAVATEAESPSCEEFSRVVNETKVGRDVGRTLEEAATRNQSVDFHWVAQAIAIHRDVGGNLADVLDGISLTIRERNQIRRQVKALSAEGKLSAYVLMALPVGILSFLSFSNPTYVAKFFSSFVGIAMLVVAVLLMAVGGFWLSRVVKIKF